MTCPVHGIYPVLGCASCPPAGHPLHDAEARRLADLTASRSGRCSFCDDSPVANAGVWTTPRALLTAPCPRCGIHYAGPVLLP